LENPGDSAADLDLYLMDCSAPEPVPGDLNPPMTLHP
jgi:hypothetical protein